MLQILSPTHKPLKVHLYNMVWKDKIATMTKLPEVGSQVPGKVVLQGPLFVQCYNRRRTVDKLQRFDHWAECWIV